MSERCRLLILLSCLSICSTSLARGQEERGFPISILHFSEGIRTVVRINGEPVHAGVGSFSFAWSDYPLRSGTNLISFTMNVASQKDRPSQPRIIISRNSSGTNEVVIDERFVVSQKDTTVRKDVLLTRHSGSNTNFEPISVNEHQEASVRGRVQKLMSAMASRDPAKVAQILTTTSETVIGEFGREVFDLQRTATMTNWVADASMVKLIFGTNLVIATVEQDVAALFELKLGNPRREFRIKSLALGKRNGAWHLVDARGRTFRFAD